MKLNWIDITSYKKGDTERIPKTWELKLEELRYRVIVTRHIYYENTWLLTCREANIELHDLKTDNVEEAKYKALKIVENYLNDLIEKISRQCEIIKSQ